MVKLFSFLALAAAAIVNAHSTCFQSYQVGTDNPLDLTFSANNGFSHEIRHDGASFLALHFKQLHLPLGARLVVSDEHGNHVEYTGQRDNFYADRVDGDKLKLEYFPSFYEEFQDAAPGIVIDGYNSVGKNIFDGVDGGNAEAICGKDDTQAIVCVKNSDPTKYQKAQAVARLFIGGSGLCTGWLFGSEGHLVTNNHCIGDAATASNIEFEFDAECATCNDPNNTKQLACKGTVVASSATFITTSVELDYTLVKLNLKSGASLSKYGYLQARESGAVLGEQIYIPQHPGGKPTRLATRLDDGTPGVISSLSIKSCQDDEVGYKLDTEGGSSGSPVLSAADNVVVALHNCGGCENGAIKIDRVVADMKKKNVLPKNALAGGPSPPTTSTPSITTPKPTTKPTTTPPPSNECPSDCDACYWPKYDICTSRSKNSCLRTPGRVWCGF